MNDLMAELAEVVRLSERATKGEWLISRAAPYYSYQISADHGKERTRLFSTMESMDFDAPSDERTSNSEFIVALVNFLRTHHAELEAMARDAEAYRKLVAGIDAEQLVAASEKHGDAMFVLRDAERYRWLREHAGSIRSDCWHWQSHGAAPLENLIDAAIDATQEGEG